jgi:hypothetical protein
VSVKARRLFAMPRLKPPVQEVVPGRYFRRRIASHAFKGAAHLEKTDPPFRPL